MLPRFQSSILTWRFPSSSSSCSQPIRSSRSSWTAGPIFFWRGAHSSEYRTGGFGLCSAIREPALLPRPTRDTLESIPEHARRPELEILQAAAGASRTCVEPRPPWQREQVPPLAEGSPSPSRFLWWITLLPLPQSSQETICASSPARGEPDLVVAFVTGRRS